MNETEKIRILKRIYGCPLPVPQSLAQLLALTKKNEVIKYIRNLKVSGGDFSDLVRGCRSIGYFHTAQHHEFVPSHLTLSTDQVHNSLASEDARGQKRICRKITAAFNERKIVAAHLFTNCAKQWHLFYFSCADADEELRNHWKHGSHMHFVNYLWSNLDSDLLWADFSKTRRTAVPGAAHIRFITQEEG